MSLARRGEMGRRWTGRTLTDFLVSAAFFFSFPAARAAALRDENREKTVSPRPPQTHSLGSNAPLRIPDLRLLVPLRENGREVGSNDTTLVLDRLPAPLLGDLLRNTLLVDTAEDDSPRDLARVLALEEEGLLLGGDEATRDRSAGVEWGWGVEQADR